MSLPGVLLFRVARQEVGERIQRHALGHLVRIESRYELEEPREGLEGVLPKEMGELLEQVLIARVVRPILRLCDVL